MADAVFLAKPFRWVGYGIPFGECIMYVQWNSSRLWELSFTAGYGFMLGHVICAGVMDKDPMKVLRALCWEGMASYMFPTLIVFHATHLTWRVLWEIKAPPPARKWVPCVLGLVLAVVLQEPLDNLANSCCDYLGL